ncbi:sialic acid-binding Ig-like lectin 14 [Genypterus blacodes]
MNIIGDLSQKDCTTIFNNLTTDDTGGYYVKIQNGPDGATAKCNPVYILVTDSPPSPSIEILGELKENQTVTVTCSTPIPCPRSPPTLTWNLPSAYNKTLHNLDSMTITATIQTTLLLLDKHDGFSIKCVSTHSVNTGRDKTSGENVHLKVSYGPKDTSASISPSNVMSRGSRVNLTCSSRSNPPATSFTWFMNTKDGAVYVSEGRVYSFNVTTSGIYYCMATNDFGHQTSPKIYVDIEGQLVVVSIIVRTLGVVLLICTLIAFQCWFRSRYST